MKRLALGLVSSASAVTAVTAAILLLEPYVPVLSLGALYIFAVLPIAVWWGPGLATAVSIGSMLAFNWFFLPPRHTFQLRDRSNWLALAVYLVTAVVVSALATRARRKAEVTIEAEALRRSDTMKTAVLRSVSHDLRSPLTAIVAAASGLANPEVKLEPDDRAELVASIRTEAERLDRIVGNLLDMSRLQSGAAEPHRELWTVDDLVSRAIDQLGPGSERVRTQLGEHVPPVEVDASQIERVLVNLLDNALKFSPPGSTVLLQVEPRGQELLLHVHDAGSGVAEAERDSVFEPFRRAEPGARGVGLGLAIARGFAEVNRGRVWTEAGTDGHFVLALPAVPG
jgi:two-component system sensor histidine kinase KdpD